MNARPYGSLAPAVLLLLLSGCQKPLEGSRFSTSGSSNQLAAPAPPDSAAPRVAMPTAPASAATPGPPVAPRELSDAEQTRYPFVPAGAQVRPLGLSIETPAGYRRTDLLAASFAAFLRDLPLRPSGTPVLSFRGQELLSAEDPRVAAVVELDVSPTDLQQCADTVLRLHAEWQWSQGAKSAIAYTFTSGDLARYQDYAAGQRPVVSEKKVSFSRTAQPDDSRKSFRRYLDLVFTYAGTVSVARDAQKPQRSDVRAGDYFVLPGGPGHAVLVLDVAVDANGKRVALLGQGFMPAQDMHVLASREPGISPWFSLEGDGVDTPFWPAPFPWSSLRRFNGM